MQRAIALISIFAAVGCNGAGTVGGPILRAPSTATPKVTPGDLVYGGGPLIQNVKVVPVFWNHGVALQSQIAAFYSTIVKSPYVDWLSEFDIGGYVIGRGTANTPIVDPNPPAGTTIDDTALQTELARLIDNGTVPKPNANTLYAMHFPPGLTITLQGSASCQTFCVYHNAFVHDGANVYYTVVPDQTTGNCATGCGVDSSTTDTTTFISSHELLDAVTDPAITLDEVGWFDAEPTGGETAQICDPQFGTVDGYVVAKGWSQRFKACVDEACAPPVCGAGACGTISNGCGSVSCGGCANGYTCTNNTCQLATCYARGCVGSYPHCICRY